MSQGSLRVVEQLVQEGGSFLQLLLLLLQHNTAAEYVLDGLSTAISQAVLGINLAELEFVAAGMGYIN